LQKSSLDFQYIRPESLCLEYCGNETELLAEERKRREIIEFWRRN